MSILPPKNCNDLQMIQYYRYLRVAIRPMVMTSPTWSCRLVVTSPAPVQSQWISKETKSIIKIIKCCGFITRTSSVLWRTSIWQGGVMLVCYFLLKADKRLDKVYRNVENVCLILISTKLLSSLGSYPTFEKWRWSVISSKS